MSKHSSKPPETKTEKPSEKPIEKPSEKPIEAKTEAKTEAKVEAPAPGSINVDGIDLKVRGTVEIPVNPPIVPTPAKIKPAVKPVPAPVEVKAVRDPLCTELRRHRPKCDCKGAARQPIV